MSSSFSATNVELPDKMTRKDLIAEAYSTLLGMEGSASSQEIKERCKKALVEVGASEDYSTFFAEILQCEYEINTTLHRLHQRLGVDRLDGVGQDPERLLRVLQELTRNFNYWKGNIDSLHERSHSMKPLQLDPRKIHDSSVLKAMCNLQTEDVNMEEGDEIIITDTTQPNRLKVRTSGGQEGYVPALCCVLPSPDQNALTATERLRIQLLASWHECLKKSRSLMMECLLTTSKALTNKWRTRIMAGTSNMVPKERVARRLRRLNDTITKQAPRWDLSKLHNALFSLEKELTSWNVNGTGLEVQSPVRLYWEAGTAFDVAGEVTLDMEVGDLVDIIASLDKTVLCYQMFSKQLHLFQRNMEKTSRPIRIVDHWEQIVPYRKGRIVRYLELRMHMIETEIREEITKILPLPAPPDREAIEKEKRDEVTEIITTTTEVVDGRQKKQGFGDRLIEEYSSSGYGVEYSSEEQGERKSAGPVAGRGPGRLVEEYYSTGEGVVYGRIPGQQQIEEDHSSYGEGVIYTQGTRTTEQQQKQPGELTEDYSSYGEGVIYSKVQREQERQQQQQQKQPGELIEDYSSYGEGVIYTQGQQQQQESQKNVSGELIEDYSSYGEGVIHTQGKREETKQQQGELIEDYSSYGEGVIYTQGQQQQQQTQEQNQYSEDYSSYGEGVIYSQGMRQQQTEQQQEQNQYSEDYSSYGEGVIYSQGMRQQQTEQQQEQNQYSEGYSSYGEGVIYTKSQQEMQQQQQQQHQQQGELIEDYSSSGYGESWRRIGGQEMEGSAGEGEMISCSASGDTVQKEEESSSEYFEMKMTMEETETREEITEIPPSEQKERTESCSEYGSGYKNETVEADQITSASSEERRRFVIRCVIDPRTNKEISIQAAISEGIVDQEHGTYVNLVTGEAIPIPEAMNTGKILVEQTTTTKTREELKAIGLITIKTSMDSRHYHITGVVDPRTGEQLSPEEAREKGLINEEEAQFTNSLTGEKFPLDDAIQHGWVLVEYEPEPALPDFDTKIYAVNAVVDQRLKKKVPFYEAVKRGLIDKETGTYINNVTGEQIYVVEAIRRGFLKAKEIEDASGLDIDAENRVVIERMEKIKKNVLKPLGVLSAFRQAAGLTH